MLNNTKKLGQQAAEFLGQSLALLLRGHGVIIVGGSIEEASVNAFALETNARIQTLCFYFRFTAANKSR